jgi:acetyl esterase/lipase
MVAVALAILFGASRSNEDAEAFHQVAESGGGSDMPAPSVNLRTGVRWYREINYAGDESTNAAKQVLDLYLPNDDSWLQGRPLLIWVHGGGWIMGDKDDAMGMYGRYCRKLAEHGIAAANVSYRLSPEVKHPGHIEDIARATAWLVEHANALGYDPAHIFVSGHSAGGHLAALLAVDDRWLTAVNVDPDAIIGAIPSSGVYDLKPMFEGRVAFGGAFPPGTAEDASPISHVDAADPPFLLFVEAHGRYMQRQTEIMTEALQKDSVECNVVEIPWSNHLTMLSDLVEDGGLTLQRTIEFVEKVLRGRPDRAEGADERRAISPD